MKKVKHVKLSQVFDTVQILCKDCDNRLFNLLQYIQKLGNQGHSFSIVVDPKSDDEKTFGWDGDGSDSIYSIKKIKAKS